MKASIKLRIKKNLHGWRGVLWIATMVAVVLQVVVSPLFAIATALFAIVYLLADSIADKK